MSRFCPAPLRKECSQKLLNELFDLFNIRKEPAMDFLAPDHPLTAQAREVTAEIDAWIEEHHNGATFPVAHLTVSQSTLEIAIGDCTVWDFENFPDYDLYRDKCLDVFLTYLKEQIDMFSEDNLLLKDEPKDEPIDDA